jgi:hypothetical protein
MPVPDDPGWKLQTDSQGCPLWTNPNDHAGVHDGTTSYCGAPLLRDAGPDADAASDASDAEAGP